MVIIPDYSVRMRSSHWAGEFSSVALFEKFGKAISQVILSVDLCNAGVWYPNVEVEGVGDYSKADWGLYDWSKSRSIPRRIREVTSESGLRSHITGREMPNFRTGNCDRFSVHTVNSVTWSGPFLIFVLMPLQRSHAQSIRHPDLRYRLHKALLTTSWDHPYTAW